MTEKALLPVVLLTSSPDVYCLMFTVCRLLCNVYSMVFVLIVYTLIRFSRGHFTLGEKLANDI